MSGSPRQHRADLAGSVAARTTLCRYLEIVYGLLLGVSMWIFDAAMHAHLDTETPTTGGLLSQLFGGLTPALFRGAYVIVAVTLGWWLWRVNLKREANDRQKHEQALAGERLRTMLAIVNTFEHDLKDPLAVISNNAKALAERAASVKDQTKLDEIAQSASQMLSLITQLSTTAPLYVVDGAGIERLALHETFEAN